MIDVTLAHQVMFGEVDDHEAVPEVIVVEGLDLA